MAGIEKRSSSGLDQSAGKGSQGASSTDKPLRVRLSKGRQARNNSQVNEVISVSKALPSGRHVPGAFPARSRTMQGAALASGSIPEADSSASPSRPVWLQRHGSEQRPPCSGTLTMRNATA